MKAAAVADERRYAYVRTIRCERAAPTAGPGILGGARHASALRWLVAARAKRRNCKATTKQRRGGPCKFKRVFALFLRRKPRSGLGPVSVFVETARPKKLFLFPCESRLPRRASPSLFSFLRALFRTLSLRPPTNAKAFLVPRPPLSFQRADIFAAVPAATVAKYE